MKDFIWVIIIGVILIIGIVFLGIALKFYKDFLGCSNEYSPWCYTDWVCNTFTDERRHPAQLTYGTAKACSKFDPATGSGSYNCSEPGTG